MIITPATDAEIITKFSENALWIGVVTCSLFPFGVVRYVSIPKETLWRSWTLLDIKSDDDGSNIDWGWTVDCENTYNWRTKLGDKEVIDNILDFNVIDSVVFIVVWEPIIDKLLGVNGEVRVEADTTITVEGIYVLTDVTFIS